MKALVQPLSFCVSVSNISSLSPLWSHPHCQILERSACFWSVVQLLSPGIWERPAPHKGKPRFINANMPSSALSLILFIHCSAAFYDLVIIISQNDHHFKATCSSRFSRWYYTRSIVRALKKENKQTKERCAVGSARGRAHLLLRLFRFSWGCRVGSFSWMSPTAREISVASFCSFFPFQWVMWNRQSTYIWLKEFLYSIFLMKALY